MIRQSTEPGLPIRYSSRRTTRRTASAFMAVETTVTLEPSSWRQAFVDLVCDFHRLLNQPPPTLHDNAHDALLVSAALGGSDFSVIHVDPQDTEGRLLLQCRIGTLPTEDTGSVLQHALIANQGLGRAGAGMLTLDVRSNDLVYSAIHAIAEVSAATLLQVMRQLAEVAHQWREIHPQLRQREAS